MKNCREESEHKLYVFEENRSKLTLENTLKAKSIRVEVDGCEIDDEGIRCDYLLIANGIEMYIELKGQDIEHAISQIERTMRLLSVEYRQQVKKSYIICTRSPLASTQIQQYARKFKSQYNSELIVKSSPYRDSY